MLQEKAYYSYQTLKEPTRVTPVSLASQIAHVLKIIVYRGPLNGHVG